MCEPSCGAEPLKVCFEYFRVIFLVPEWPGDHLFFGSFETWQPPRSFVNWELTWRARVQPFQDYM